jgi:opacity protein-like surface antigen
MKSILSAAALLAALASTVLAEEAAAPQPQPQPQAAAQEVIILPAATAPATAEAQPARVEEPAPQSTAAKPMGGGCGHANKTVYLTN